MKKVLTVMKHSWSEYFVYRVNFFLWRLRVVVTILISFSLWQAIYQYTPVAFGYPKEQMLTYMLVMLLIQGVVFSSQSQLLAEDIQYGRLSRYLLLPFSYFGYLSARDAADKMINGIFAVGELIVLVLLFQLPIHPPPNIFAFILFLVSTLFASILYFEIGSLLSFIGFWSSETWAPRFLFFTIITFLAGTYFPLDILPPPLSFFLQLLPFSYLIFFPLKLYLGQVQFSFIAPRFFLLLCWVAVLYFLMRFFWRKGLKIYTAQGS